MNEALQCAEIWPSGDHSIALISDQWIPVNANSNAVLK
jgi:hypothetical protein